MVEEWEIAMRLRIDDEVYRKDNYSHTTVFCDIIAMMSQLDSCLK